MTNANSLTAKMLEALHFFGLRNHRFASDFPCSKSVLYKLRDAGYVTMQAHHRETSVAITPLGRAVTEVHCPKCARVYARENTTGLRMCACGNLISADGAA
jgi:hypothetical protein